MRKILVHIIQPVVPHYRLALFEALAGHSRFAVKVHASRSVPGAPQSVPDLPGWADISHHCFSWLGGRVLWQSRLSLPDAFGRGDVLVVNGNPRFLSNIPLILRARRLGAGIVWWGHGWSPTSRPWRAALRFRLMAVADVILLYTDAEVSALADQLPKGRRILALNNALDPAPMERARAQWPQDRLEQFQSANHLSDKKVLLFCGRLKLKPSTELDVAIRALSMLVDRDGPDKYLLVVIGDGEDKDRLVSLAEELGVNNGIRWVGPIFEESKLAPWFMSASCFVFPGAIGLSLIHALSYGLPVITHSNIALHNPEIAALKHEINGLLFEKSSSDDLSLQISRLTSNPELWNQMSAAASATVLTEFSFVRVVERFAEAIEAAAATTERQYSL